MTPGEFKEFARTAKELGIFRVKMGEVEFEFDNSSQSLPIESTVPPDAPNSEADPIQHKQEQLASLLKLSNEELVDQLFPDHTEQEEAV